MDIVSDVDGNVFLTGSFHGAVDFDPGSGTAALTCEACSSANPSSGDGYVASYDAFGGFRWAFRLGGGVTGSSGRSIAIDAYGNVVVAGYVRGIVDFDPGSGTANRGTSNVTSAFVAKYSSSGGYLWAFALAGASPMEDQETALAVQGAGDVVIAGTFSGTVDFDPGAGTATLKSAASGYRGIASPDIYVARYSSSGSYRWAFRAGGPSTDMAQGVALDQSGNVLVTGTFSGTVDFNPTKSINSLTSSSTIGGNMFVARYSSTGSYAWAIAALGTAMSEGLSIATDAGGNVVVGGWFDGTVDFDPGIGTASLANGGMFFARYNAAGGYLSAFSPGKGTTRAVKIDGDGNIVIAGHYHTTGDNVPNDFDPGPGTASFMGNGAFVAKYTQMAGFLWVTGSTFDPTNPGSSVAHGLLIDSFTRIVGTFNRSVDFDPGPDGTTLTASPPSGNDIFIASYAEQMMPKVSRGSDVAGPSQAPASLR